MAHIPPSSDKSQSENRLFIVSSWDTGQEKVAGNITREVSKKWGKGLKFLTTSGKCKVLWGNSTKILRQLEIPFPSELFPEYSS
jgi:hypothetical protein